MLLDFQDLSQYDASFVEYKLVNVMDLISDLMKSK